MIIKTVQVHDYISLKAENHYYSNFNFWHARVIDSKLALLLQSKKIKMIIQNAFGTENDITIIELIRMLHNCSL